MSDFEELPLADAARRLGIDISTLRRRLKRGEHEYVQDSTGRYTVRIYVGDTLRRVESPPMHDAYAPMRAPTPDAEASRREEEVDAEASRREEEVDAEASRRDPDPTASAPTLDAYALYQEVLRQRDYLLTQNERLSRQVSILIEGLAASQLLPRHDIYEITGGESQDEADTVDVTSSEETEELVIETPMRPSRRERIRAWWARMDEKGT